MINVELKGGAVKEFENGTTPAEIAKSIGAGLDSRVIVDGSNPASRAAAIRSVVLFV